MTNAYASSGGSAGIASIIPLLMFGIIYGFVLKFIAKRIGKNEWLWFVIGLIPLVNGFAGLWLMCTAFNYIMDKLEYLDKSISRVDSI